MAITQGVNGALTQLLGDVTVDQLLPRNRVPQLVGNFLGFLVSTKTMMPSCSTPEHAGHCIQLVGVHDLHVSAGRYLRWWWSYP